MERALGNCSNPSKKKKLDLAGTSKHHNNSRRMYTSSNSRRWHPMLTLLSTGAMQMAKAMLRCNSINSTVLKNSIKIISSSSRSSSSKSLFSLKSNTLITMLILGTQSTISKIKIINTNKNSLKLKTHKKIRKKQSRNLLSLMMQVPIATEAEFSQACSASLVELPLAKVMTKLKLWLKSPLKNQLNQ